jgi:hypothetical protein
VPSPSPRRFAVLLAGVLLVAALAAATGRSTGQEALQVRAHAYTLNADASAPLRQSRLEQADVTFRGGPITTSTGETVDVEVSTALPAETSTPESWAEFLTGLAHGPEIALLTAYIVTLDEVAEICGSNALGCYGHDELVAPGELALTDTTADEVVRHEYGHHIALHRLNTPWDAIDWGPKRWASAADVCGRVARRDAFPGDQGVNYTHNPGEAWAETYRLMDERDSGITTATWPIISESFYPNDAALQAAEQDVAQPWVKPRTTAFTRVFGKKKARVWWIPLSTPLDGDLRVTATVPRGATPEVALVGGDRKAVLRRADWVGQRAKRLAASVCGQRSLFVRVTQKGALGRVRVSVTAP